ncbi:sodium/proline symporter PutP [Fusobacterium perfoetens]|uniref:sodium/proline symporter PutP n=1 Tax=Fusobacterium perfoetens TaxID=852 RepID=UPI000480DD5A|nr:sodium/proline symporter PutP [Fusobacterium perfoetens]MCI6151995.1 sodium/proline symporter PutP [Fusobacterium perfoetens]MDY3237908.1 sodium/proline symporter PutP [Fusobacterium perfoetens]
MATTETLITFVIYLIFLMAVGIYFYKKTETAEDYVLGGRGMGSWVTALSAQASDMSGWLLMGLPGAVYMTGMSQTWTAIGLTLGTYLNWRILAPKLRVQTEETDSMTLPNFLSKKLGDDTGTIRIFSAIVILFFFTIYSSSGIVAAGKLFSSILGIDYKLAVLIGVGTIVFYTFMGGYLACCWTDFFQGTLMFLAILIVPVLAYTAGGGIENIQAISQARNISLSLFHGSRIGILGIISALAWGLGYFGQPHILVRFMSVKNLYELKKARIIAMLWVIISLIGAVAIGITGIGLFADVSKMGGDSEKVFIYMISMLFNPWVGGVMLAAILSAIMSTIDSQLLVSASTLSEDFYRYIKKDASEKEIMWTGRIGIILISVIATIIAMDTNSQILSMVSYAWGGFGGAFGPAILMTLYCEKLNWKSVFTGMLVGVLVIIFWKLSGLGNYLYEILPAFVLNGLTVYLSEKFVFGKVGLPQKIC